jgi:hypothetical protein
MNPVGAGTGIGATGRAGGKRTSAAWGADCWGAGKRPFGVWATATPLTAADATATIIL